jgi:hypothetical protein
MSRYSIQKFLGVDNTELVLRPACEGRGNWVGAPAAYWDREKKYWLLLIRYRHHKKRGYKTVLYATKNGTDLTQVKTYTSNQLKVTSIERGAITRENNTWEFYLSWERVDRDHWILGLARNRWIEQIEPESFEIIYDCDTFETDMIKDPVIYDGKLYVHIRKNGTKSTYLADGDRLDKVVIKTDNWARYCQRITSIIKGTSGYFAFYDGAESIEFNQEEKTGILFGECLSSFSPIGPNQPALVSDVGSGSIRYLEAREHDDDMYIWYEYCNADWSHELRFTKVSRKRMLQVLENIKD